MYKLHPDYLNRSYKKISDLQSKRVIVRSCLNITLNENLKPSSLFRLKESVKLLNEISKNCRSIVILAHLGRPEPGSTDSQFSFKNILSELNSLVPDNKIELHDSVESILHGFAHQNGGNIYLLENIRLFPGEESADSSERKKFAKELAQLGDVFINDSFADYRKSASNYDIAREMISYIGPSFLNEIEGLSKLSNAAKPFTAVLGGAKLSEKIELISSIASIADTVLIGGAMAYTFLKASGIEVGKSLVEESKIEDAKRIFQKYRQKIILPLDHKYLLNFSQFEEPIESRDSSLNYNQIGIDIGPQTIKKFEQVIADSKTVLWNGPMGIFEWPNAKEGTQKIVNAINNNKDCYSVVGGGDTTAASENISQEFSFLSTGGGAMLEFLSKNEFDILDVILNKNK